MTGVVQVRTGVRTRVRVKVRVRLRVKVRVRVTVPNPPLAELFPAWHRKLTPA